SQCRVGVRALRKVTSRSLFDRVDAGRFPPKDPLVSRRWFLVYKIRDTSGEHGSRPRNPRDAHAPVAPPPRWRDNVVSILQGDLSKVATEAPETRQAK